MFQWMPIKKPQVICPLAVKQKKSHVKIKSACEEQEFRQIKSLMHTICTGEETGFKNLHQLLVLEIQKHLHDKKMLKQ